MLLKQLKFHRELATIADAMSNYMSQKFFRLSFWDAWRSELFQIVFAQRCASNDRMIPSAVGPFLCRPVFSSSLLHLSLTL